MKFFLLRTCKICYIVASGVKFDIKFHGHSPYEEVEIAEVGQNLAVFYCKANAENFPTAIFYREISDMNEYKDYRMLRKPTVRHESADKRNSVWYVCDDEHCTSAVNRLQADQAKRSYMPTTSVRPHQTYSIIYYVVRSTASFSAAAAAAVPL